jgi:Uma2 family endonuclease
VEAHVATETKAGDRILAADEFWELPEQEGYRLALSRGRVVREPAPGMRHGQVAGSLYRRLSHHLKRQGRGLVFSDTPFALTADRRTVRVPDVAFLSRDRMPLEGVSDRSREGAPDLAVEMVSPLEPRLRHAEEGPGIPGRRSAAGLGRGSGGENGRSVSVPLRDQDSGGPGRADG